MAEAQFIPGAGAGSIVGALNAGLETGASMMDRAQQRRLNEEADQRAREEEARRADQAAILRPALIEKANADVAEAKAHVAGLEQTERARAAASSLAPTARQEFDAIMQMPDADERELAGIRWVARYGQLENIATYSKEFQSKKEMVAKMHTEAAALRQLTLKIQGDKDVAKLRGENAIKVAGTRAEAGDKIARYRSELEAAREAGDEEGVALYSSLLQKAAASPINTAYGSEQMQQKLEAARAAGDPEETAFWEKRIKALTERGVRKDPAELADALSKGFGAAPGTAPAAPAAAAPSAKTPPADPFSKVKL